MTDNPGNELRELREAGGLSLWDVAAACNLSANQLSLRELGRTALSEDVYDRIKAAIVRITRERHQSVKALAGIGREAA